MDDVEAVREELRNKEKEISILRGKLLQLEKGTNINSSHGSELHKQSVELPPITSVSALSNEDIMRYSRQLIVPDFGVRGQLKLAETSVLVVGCGGLGCPLAQYLAAAGIGRLGLLDFDDVELNNLHRQVLHGENRIGMPKSFSAAIALKQLNSRVECIPYHMQLNHKNASHLIKQYDIVADCSDNVPTRYLVNDVCVLRKKPLVSASALRMEGQLTVYNYCGGPCYRCLYPKPPPPETVTNCADGGVLGVVPGIMGCLQALEVLKIASGMGSLLRQQMLIFDALETRFHKIKLRPKQPRCEVCGECPSVKELVDYELFCGSTATDKEYKRILDDGLPHVLVDVRPPVEVDICSLPQSVFIPLSHLEKRSTEYVQLLQEKIQEKETSEEDAFLVYVICKQGNDSQKAVKILETMSGLELCTLLVKDIQGGLMAWSQKVDTSFPQY
ncbi:adenylyltransferase and sulfurtransferase MOCS3 isoform X2 [Protopterus annectens]|uniref:adenylyltransferase and sulfurtransferase MOCS3 isoform X2 n=1 Tax=Protopterus annectens TaxID=7888 RepID=UPI001CF99C88|nr:adenylyltransferase and sulfurtransferase MOCS3 isoform X2 [Protopterus annectens]